MNKFKSLSVISLLGLMLYTAMPSQSFAASGAIWTTGSDCGVEVQDQNHYAVGDHVFINGANFDAGDYDWVVKGPGANGEIDASGTITVDETGAFCFDAYTVTADDSGVYQVNVGNKNDNFSVKGTEEGGGQDQTGNITVTKIVQNDDGGTAQVSDFTLKVGDTVVTSGVKTEFAFGSYVVSETGGPSGYTGSFSGDCDANGNITVDSVDDDLNCTLTNNDNPANQEQMGTIHINKYVCDSDTAFDADMTPDTSGNATIPAGCEKATTGYQVGAVFEAGNTTTNPPYPSSSDFSLLGTTNSSGELVVSVPSGGRHFLAEGDGSGNFPATLDNLIALACEDDSGSHTNNFEAVFVEPNATEYCNIYNKRSQDTVNLTVIKHVVGGDKVASDFRLYVSDNVAPDTFNILHDFQGSEAGQTFAIPVGTHLHTAEDQLPGYTLDQSADCDVLVVAGHDLTCTLTNTFNGSQQGNATLIIKKFVCDSGTDITSAMIPDKDGNFTMSDNCDQATGNQAGQQIGTIFESGRNDNLGPYPTSFALAGTINSSGTLTLTNSESGRYDIAEGDGNSNFGSNPDGFIGIACTTDTGAHTDNYEIAQVTVGETSYCNVFDVKAATNTGGNVVINKYVCTDDAVLDTVADSSARPNNSGEATIPNGCTLTNGFSFGYIHEANKDDLSVPYPGLDDNTPFTAISGQTGDNGTGKLILTDLPTGGRLDLKEMNVDDSDVLAFMCNEDTGIQDNNYEVVFNAPDKTSYCNVFNAQGTVGGAETGLNVHLIKVVCDDSFDNAEGPTPISPNEIPDNCDLSSGWSFRLSTDFAQTSPVTYGPTNANGEIKINIHDLDVNLKNALEAGNQIWVSEIAQDNVATFGDLRCNTDAANQDNLDALQVDPQNMPDDIYCIAYNVAVPTLTHHSSGGGGSSNSRKISGMKYNDANGNGIRDAGESGLEGWVIYIDENNNNVMDSGEESDTTDSDGQYSFNSLSNGTYTIREVDQTGWSQTEPGPDSGLEYSVVITNTDKVHTGIDFGNIHGSVSGASTENPGEVLGESLDVGGSAEGLPVTGINFDSFLFILMLAGLALMRANRKSQAS
jgi:hypothetical protein